MVEIKEALTKKQQKEFIEFPLKLYKGCPNFVPPLYGDEKKMFRKDYCYYDMCEAVYFNAYEDGRMVGRISGILQKASNEKHGEKRIRFTRFDAIDSQKVATALFDAVEKWGLEKGMDTICGPLGFSDLEREGLLVEGFDQLSTFEEQYNYDYYGKLIEGCGYKKEVDWLESKIYLPKEDDGKLDEITEFVFKRYHLRYGTARNTREFIKRYGDQIFELVDKAYIGLYGTVPFTDAMKKMLIDNFLLIIDMKYVSVVLDENDKMVCFGVCFPSIAPALVGTSGRLTPLTLIRLFKAIKRPKVLDLGIVGVDPLYANRGVATAVSSGLLGILKRGDIEYAETNLNLEDNFNIQNQWKRFDAHQHKRRRSYVKTLSPKE